MQVVAVARRALVAGGLLAVLAAPIVGLVAYSVSPWGPTIQVRWRSELVPERRQVVEAELGLRVPEARDIDTWAYQIREPTHEHLAALVSHPDVVDTHGFDRATAEPPVLPDSAWENWLRWVAWSFVLGLTASLLRDVARSRTAVRQAARDWSRSARRLLSKHWRLTGIVVLALITLLAHGHGLRQLGFYSDEWAYLSFGLELGPDGLSQLGHVEEGSENLAFRIWGLLFGFFGMNPLPYHALVLLLRWGIGCVYWAVFRLLWPEVPERTFAAACLVLVYPGYLDGYSAVIDGAWLTALLVHGASILMSLVALTTRSRVGKLAGHSMAILMALGATMVLFPKLVVLELWRLVLLGCRAMRQTRCRRRALRMAVKAWLPYGLLLVGVVAWAVFVRSGPTPERDVAEVARGYFEAPWSAAGLLAQRALSSTWHAVAAAWLVPASRYFDAYMFPTWSVAMSALAAAVLVAATIAILGPVVDGAERGATRSHGAWQMALVGACGVATGLAPIVLAGRHVSMLIDESHRYTLAALAGAALLAAGVLFAVLRRHWVAPAVGVLVAIAVIAHGGSLSYYAKASETQRLFWWQVAWRFPEGNPGMPVAYSPPPSLPSPVTDKVRYPLRRLGIEARHAGSPADADRLALDLLGSPDTDLRYLFAVQPTREACVQFLDAGRPEVFPRKTGWWARRFMPWAGSIVSAPGEPSAAWSLFGDEPERGFCYFFQTASAALSRGDWQDAAARGKLVLERELRGTDGTEMLPFVEAFVRVGSFGPARAAFDESLRLGASRVVACSAFRRGRRALDGSARQAVADLLRDAGC